MIHWSGSCSEALHRDVEVFTKDGKVDKEKASSSSHSLRTKAKESARHRNSFAVFIVVDVESESI
jgi:hypothetical protein